MYRSLFRLFVLGLFALPRFYRVLEVYCRGMEGHMAFMYYWSGDLQMRFITESGDTLKGPKPGGGFWGGTWGIGTERVQIQAEATRCSGRFSENVAGSSYKVELKETTLGVMTI